MLSYNEGQLSATDSLVHQLALLDRLHECFMHVQPLPAFVQALQAPGIQISALGASLQSSDIVKSLMEAAGQISNGCRRRVGSYAVPSTSSTFGPT